MKKRNPIALNPLLRKGGVHKKAKSGQRRKAKNELKQSARQWRDEL